GGCPFGPLLLVDVDDDRVIGRRRKRGGPDLELMRHVTEKPVVECRWDARTTGSGTLRRFAARVNPATPSPHSTGGAAGAPPSPCHCRRTPPRSVGLARQRLRRPQLPCRFRLRPAPRRS